jgi:hypothetical protein
VQQATFYTSEITLRKAFEHLQEQQQFIPDKSDHVTNKFYKRYFMSGIHQQEVFTKSHNHPFHTLINKKIDINTAQHQFSSNLRRRGSTSIQGWFLVQSSCELVQIDMNSTGGIPSAVQPSTLFADLTQSYIES